MLLRMRYDVGHVYKVFFFLYVVFMLTMGRWKDAVVLENSVEKFKIFRIKLFYFDLNQTIDKEIIRVEISKLDKKLSET